MVPFSLVYFEGGWSEEEAALIEAAAEGAEDTVPAGGSDVSAPWVAVAHDAGTTGMYLASRQGCVEVIAADSPKALAEKIRALETSSHCVGA